MEVLREFPGLEYLALVPRDLWCNVSNWCRMSPTVRELRDVVGKYGKLSPDISRVVLTGSHTLLYTDHSESVWATYWEALLLGEEEDSSEFRYEMERRLGPPRLAGGAWCPNVDEVAGKVGSLEGLSFSAVPQVYPAVVPFAVETVDRLFSGLASQFVDVDDVKSGYGLSCNKDSPYKKYADLLMDKYHVWQDVGAEFFPRPHLLTGYCYQKLFTGDVHDVLTLALGAYPDSAKVAAFYVAGVVYGFSVLDGLSVEVQSGRVGDTYVSLHVSHGVMSAAEIFSQLVGVKAVVGGRDFFSSDATLVPDPSRSTLNLPLVQLDTVPFGDLCPQLEDLVVCMDDASYRLALARLGDSRGTYKIVMWDRRFDSTDTVWVVADVSSAGLTSSKRGFLASSVLSGAKRVVYVHDSAPLFGENDLFYLSIVAGHSLHKDFDKVGFLPTSCKDHLRKDPMRKFSSLLSSSAVVANIPVVPYGEVASTLADSTGVMLMLRNEVESVGGLNVYTSTVSFPEKVAVLVPPCFNPGIKGAIVNTGQDCSCVLLDACAYFQMETVEDYPGVLLSYLAFDSTQARAQWHSSRFSFDVTSCDSRMSAGAMYVQAPTAGLVCNTAASIVEVSEPFNSWKKILRYRVVARDKKFSVELPQHYRRIVVSKLYSSKDDLSVTLTVGRVTLRRGGVVAVDPGMLKLCSTDKKRLDKISFNIHCVADDYCFDDGGPSDDDISDH